MAASRTPRQSPTPSAQATAPVAPVAPATKTPVKRAPAAKRAVRAPAARAAAKSRLAVMSPPPVAPPPAASPAKPHREKLMRDSFTMPAGEYALIGQLKQRAVALARPAKKSELLRAGLKALAAMSDETLLAALVATPTIKTGRPQAGKPADETAGAGKGKKRAGKKS